MDVKIAVITGTVFAGVLVAGALAAPRGDGGTDSGADPALDSTALVSSGGGSGSQISQTYQRRADHDDDDRYENHDDHDDDEDDD